MSYEIVPTGHDCGDDMLPYPGFRTSSITCPGTRVPGVEIFAEYEVLLVPVAAISKPGNTREYPAGYW